MQRLHAESELAFAFASDAMGDVGAQRRIVSCPQGVVGKGGFDQHNWVLLAA